ALFAGSLHAATVAVDATDARRGIFHTHVTMPAVAGPMTFVYPKWIPGEHTPTGPLMQVAGLHVRANGTELAWTRDPVEMFSFRVDVPQGATSIDVDFDYVSPSITFGGGYGESANATQHLLELPWNHVVVYPSGVATDRIEYRASLRLPAGWKFDTALPIEKQDGQNISFAPVSLTTLIDSTVIAGEYMRIIPIAEDGKLHLSLAADSAEALALSDERIAQVRNLVGETDALFGARHYRTYRWLVGLSDLLETQGLEHHESSDNRAPERAYSDPANVARYITTLSHEFVHSWNGKYRRPAGLATPDYQAPMRGELLWVYEGMTRYLGDIILTARSGMRTPEEDRDFIAHIAGTLERNRPGRSWRPLADTAVNVQTITMAPNEGVPYRRSLDYYDESGLIWLEADTIIRAKTGGAKTFDDFCHVFFGPPSSAPMVKPYTIDDVVAALSSVVANDWRAFLEQRVYRVNEHAPLGGIEAAGWRLVFNDKPNVYTALRERTSKVNDVSFSLGFWVKDDGTITDVVHNSPAFAAGLMPGMKIHAIDGRKFSSDVLLEELRARKPLNVDAEQGTSSMTLKIDYSGGERYAHLERIEGKPDVLSDIIRPHRK
ncbi:MAG TPA: M61 family peptidase, partial [Thermoanaerobaculia bacterium]|nr:M61 family peptidase [Thermoanaerobaculia bacterium]